MTPKLTEVTLPFPFQPNRWYHVAITHSTGSALSSSVIRMFVDGSLEASSRFKYAKVWMLQLANACAITACAQIAELQPQRCSYAHLVTSTESTAMLWFGEHAHACKLCV